MIEFSKFLTVYIVCPWLLAILSFVHRSYVLCLGGCFSTLVPWLVFEIIYILSR